jgi:hypothetical protein
MVNSRERSAGMHLRLFNFYVGGDAFTRFETRPDSDPAQKSMT